MAISYSSGDFDKLKVELNDVVNQDLWQIKNDNLYQARLANGAVVNYYATTGSILVQGKEQPKKEVESLIKNTLAFSNKTNSEPQFLASPVPLDKEDNQIDTTNTEEALSSKFLSYDFPNTELVIGLVGAVGVEYKQVVEILKERLKRTFDYETIEIRVSKDVIEQLPIYDKGKNLNGEFEKISYYMEVGNEARRKYNDNSVLAMGAAQVIKNRRPTNERCAYIINSLKHPDEVKFLREIYGQGFFMIGVFSDKKDRHKFLTSELQLDAPEAELLIARDSDESVGHGQHTSDTFHLSDLFVYVDENRYKLKDSIHRYLDILFGKPFVTPTFGEYAMFMSFATSLRSADLSRQVGAVITKNEEILASGANDCPRSGGGLYWPYFDEEEKQIIDTEMGRDYKRGEDSNSAEKLVIINDIVDKLPSEISDITRQQIKSILTNSKIKDLTEYGRVVHAEMEALMMCSRNNISAKNSILFTTTFPCHNCAKHIIAAGVSKVVYIEPYPKSKALDFHAEAIKLGFRGNKKDNFVYFEPFVGVGPRKFFDLFSLNLGAGRPVKRKDKEGKVIEWNPSSASLKIPLIQLSYLQREEEAGKKFKALTTINNP